MPRAKIETAFIGHYALAILDECEPVDAGVLIRALAGWILRDDLPDDANLPAHLRVLWRIIREESDAIHDARKQLRENGAHGGRPKANQTEPKGNQKETKSEPKGNQKESKIEIEVEREIENTPANAGGASRPAPAPAREPWEPCEDCPLEEALVQSEARRVGLDEKELENWRDYWTMREWRSDPRSARPMTRAGVKSSIRRWATEKGVREAREAHLDAKADERAAKRTAELAAANRPAPPESLSIDEQDERAERLRAAHPEDFARV